MSKFKKMPTEDSDNNGPFIDFGIISDNVAQKYCDCYSKSVAKHAHWLAEEMLVSGVWLGGNSPSTPTLTEAWAWFKERLDSEGADRLACSTGTPTTDCGMMNSSRPPWCSSVTGHPFMTDCTLWIIEGIGALLASEILKKFATASWQVYKVKKSLHDINQNTTVLTKVPCGWTNPSRMVYGAVVEYVYHNKDWNRNELDELLLYVGSEK